MTLFIYLYLIPPYTCLQPYTFTHVLTHTCIFLFSFFLFPFSDKYTFRTGKRLWGDYPYSPLPDFCMSLVAIG